jgi:hypothetical protein
MKIEDRFLFSVTELLEGTRYISVVFECENYLAFCLTLQSSYMLHFIHIYSTFCS